MGKITALGQLGMDLAGQAGQGILGAGLGLLMEGHEDKRQLRQQEALMRQQMAGNQEMTKFNNEQQRQMQMRMWKDTNYPAQVKMLKEAGLNPGLMYGMSGGGGTSIGGSGQSSGMSGGMAVAGKGTATEMAMAAANMGLMRAQKENIEADTANKKADIPVKGATVTNITEDTKGKELDNILKNSSMMDKLSIIENEAKQEVEKLGILETENKLDANTRLDKELLIANEALKKGFESTGEDIKNEKLREEITAIKQEVINGIEKIKQGWKEIEIKGKLLTIEEKRTAIQKYLAEYTANHPEVGKVIGGTIQRIGAIFGKPSNETKIKF